MRKAVKLAQDARDIHYKESKKSTKIALSLGPFGASLSPTQEFDGVYPPPFGPHAYSSNVNSFREDEKEEERKAIEALAEFHFDRLMVYVEDEPTWNVIDCLAFETVPLMREVRAIRVAMRRAERELAIRKRERKPWWISMIFPDGKSPERKAENGDHVEAREVASAALAEEDNLPLPSAMGINCTGVEHISAILRTMAPPIGQRPLWLVLYPNAGDVYDIHTQQWRPPVSGSKEKWVEDIQGIVGNLKKNRIQWGGVIVGGCCRTGPPHIRLLRDALATFHQP